MLNQQQQTTLKVVAAVGTIQVVGVLALLHRSFQLENKAIALGGVVLAHAEDLSEADLKRLAVAGMPNFIK